MRGAAIVLLVLVLGACGGVAAPAIVPDAHSAPAVHPKDDGTTSQVPVTGRDPLGEVAEAGQQHPPPPQLGADQPGSVDRFSDGHQPGPSCQSLPMAEKGTCPAGSGG